MRGRRAAARRSGSASTGSSRLARVGFFGTWDIGEDGRQALAQLNRPLEGAGVGLFTPSWGARTPAARNALDVVLSGVPAATPNIDLGGQVVSVRPGGGTAIPTGRGRSPGPRLVASAGCGRDGRHAVRRQADPQAVVGSGRRCDRRRPGNRRVRDGSRYRPPSSSAPTSSFRVIRARRLDSWQRPHRPRRRRRPPLAKRRHDDARSGAGDGRSRRRDGDGARRRRQYDARVRRRRAQHAVGRRRAAGDELADGPLLRRLRGTPRGECRVAERRRCRGGAAPVVQARETVDGGRPARRPGRRAADRARPASAGREPTGSSRMRRASRKAGGAG